MTVTISILDRETKSQSLTATPHSPEGSSFLALPELAAGPRRSYSSECRVAEHIMCKPKNWYCRNIFPLSNRHTLLLIPGLSGDTEGRPLRSASHHYWKSKATKAVVSFPQLTLPHPSELHCLEHLAAGESPGISWIWKPHLLLHSPVRLVP